MFASSASFEGSPLGMVALEKARELFQVCDQERKGFIIKRDMQRLSTELPGLTADQLEEVFDSLDQQRNGFLTEQEFTRGFGAFLGLQMPDEDFDDPPNFNSGNVLTNGNSNSQPVDEESFTQMVDTLGATELFHDKDEIHHLWNTLRQDQPELLKNFECFLNRVSDELSRSKSEHQSLESALEQRAAAQEVEVQRLYEEMEQQIRLERERIANEERIKSAKQREELERELEERNQQMQELASKFQMLERTVSASDTERSLSESEKERFLKEKQELDAERRRLLEAAESAESRFEETRQQLEQLKKQQREERRARAQQTFKVTEGIASERENLVRELDKLRSLNQQLKDAHDEVKNPSASSSPSKLKHKDSTIGNYLENRSRPAIIPVNPSDIESEYEVDDSFQPPVSATIPTKPVGNSLFNELDAALRNESDSDSVNPLEQKRVEPVGANQEPTRAYQEATASSPSSIRDSAQPERVFKVVFVGDSGVGKTCFIHRFCLNRFRSTFSATIGVDFQVKSMVVEGRMIALQLWDTAGQERFRSITKQYFRKADGVILMYDVTNESSFLNLRNWIHSVRDGVDEGCVLCIVGNKADLSPSEDSRALKYKDGQRIADEFGALFYESSAASGENVNEAMESLAMLLRDREDKQLAEAVKLDLQPVKKRWWCCGKS